MLGDRSEDSSLAYNFYLGGYSSIQYGYDRRRGPLVLLERLLV
jgi:hypothetical protein